MLKNQIELKAQKKARIPQKELNKLRQGRFEPETEKGKKSSFRVKIKHIRKAEDFSSVLKEGAKRRGKTIAVSAQRNTTGPRKGLEIGVIVTKKSAPQATLRNYIRRVIYAFFIERGQEIKPGTRIIVRVIRDIKETNRKALSQEIREDLLSAATQLGLEKNEKTAGSTP